MRTRVLIVVLVAVAFAALVSVGFELTGALRQMGSLAGAAALDAAPAVAARSQPVAPHEAPVAATAQPLPPEDDPSVREPLPRFDADAAVREAGDRDANVAELLNDPDQAVGAAVRDFITQLEPPGSR